MEHQRIVLATGNTGKVKELNALVSHLPIELLSLDDLPDRPEVVEDGVTFEDNARKKARALAQATGLTALADDSGLCVDALGGRPGVRSARYGGPDATDEDRCRLLLDELLHVPDEQRTARFVCALALVDPDGHERLFRGVAEGRIIRELRGSSGFGYDPVFLHEESGLTFAELDPVAKSRVSHRGQALRTLVADLTGPS